MYLLAGNKTPNKTDLKGGWGDLLGGKIEQLRNRHGFRQIFVKGSVMCSGPGSLVLGCASLVWPHSQLLSSQNPKQPAKNVRTTGSLLIINGAKSVLAPDSQQEMWGSFRWECAGHCLFLKQQLWPEWELDGLEPGSHNPKANHTQIRWLRTWKNTSQRKFWLLSQEGSEDWS